MKVLMLLDNVGTNDRRVQRESEALAENGFDITLVCLKGKNLPESETKNGVKIVRLFDGEQLFDVKNRSYAKNIAVKLAQQFSPDYLHTHDREMLHVAKYFLPLRPAVKHIHDIHEMHFSFPVISSGSGFMIKIKSRLVHEFRVIREKRDSKIITHFITVNESLEEKLRLHYQLPQQGVVVRNIPEKISIANKSNIIREKFNIPNSTKILVFIGSNIYRKVLNLEQVIDEVGNQPNLAFVFICHNNLNKKLVEEYVKLKNYTNVYFHGLLPIHEIQEHLSSCDVGLVPTWNKVNLSYWYALDNKLFEYMMSEIPVLATQQPEYIKIVDGYKIGVCVNPEEPNAYLNGLNKILKDYVTYIPNLKKAKEELNWENEKLKLINLYQQIA